MYLPIEDLLGLTRHAVPLAYRLTARRRARLFAAGGPVSLPCRLDTGSRAGLLSGHRGGRLVLGRARGSALFVPDGGAPAVEVPFGGRIVLVTSCDPTVWASSVGRLVTRYEAGPRQEFWIETAAPDAPLLHQALTARPAVRLEKGTGAAPARARP